MCTADCLLVFFVRAANTFLLNFFPFPSNDEHAQKIELLVVECDDVEALRIILAFFLKMCVCVCDVYVKPKGVDETLAKVMRYF